MNLSWLRATSWCMLWMALALLPMMIALVGERPAARGFLLEFGVMLGLLGLGVMAAQAVISGRQRWFARGLGQDNVLQFHRHTGVFALCLVLAHPLTLFLADPGFLTFLDPRDGLLRAVSLSLVLLASVVLVVSSLWRLAFRLSYEIWRVLHGVLFMVIVTGGLGHALMVDHYSAGLATKAALIMVVGASICLLLETRLLRVLRIQRQPYRVIDVQQKRGDCTALVLSAENGKRMGFRAGQFAWLSLGDSPWQLQQHPFSFSSSTEDDTLEFTIKALGDFTSTLADTQPGTRAWLEGPYGVFTCEPEQCSKGAVFIAGGVGITPVLSMLRTARDRQQRAPLWLIYGSESWEASIFRDELEQLAGQLPLTLVHVLEEAHEDWQGETGHIDSTLLDRHLPDQIADLPCYVCGPDPMADQVEPYLLRRGVPSRQLYSERFGII